MKKKKLYPILTALVLTILFSMLLFYMGCGIPSSRAEEIAATERLAEKEEELLAEKEEERLAKAKEEEQSETEEPVPAEETATEAESFPNGNIYYTGDISGVAVNLTVNFKHTTIYGRIQNPAGVYDDFIVTDGNIDLDTLEITAIFWGITEIDSDGNEIYSELTVKGKISDDLSTFNGVLLSDEGESGEFTATRETAQ